MKFLRLTIIIFLALAVFKPAFVYSQDSVLELSLDTALLFSLNNNPDVKIAGEQKNQSGFAVDEARSAYYPQVSLTGSAGREYNDPAIFKEGETHTGTGMSNYSTEYKLSANQLLFDGFATPSEVQRRKQLVQSADYQSEIVRQKIIIDTAQAYLDVYRYQKTLDEVDAYIVRLMDITDKVKLMVEAGAENLTKEKYAQSRLSSAELEKNHASSLLADAITDLEFLTGKLPPFHAIRPKLADVLGQELTQYVDAALKENKNLLLNESDKTALEHQLKKTRGQYYPTVNMLVEYGKTNNVGGESGGDTSAAALIQMNYKLFDGFGRDATKKRVTSEIVEAGYKSDRIKRDFKQKIMTAYNQIQSLEEELSIVESETTTNQELQALYREQFELGEGDIINLIEGEERLFHSSVRTHEIESDIVLNGLELLRQVGFLNKEGFCNNC